MMRQGGLTNTFYDKYGKRIWTKKIADKSLGAIKEYPEVGRSAYGVSGNWQNEPLWS